MKNLINQTRSIKKTLLTGTIMAALSVSQFANAQQDNLEESYGFSQQQETKNELIGMGSVAVLGAGVGGPVGAVVGGIIGLVIGDQANDEKRSEDLFADLNHKQKKLDAAEAQYLALQSEYQETLLALNELKTKQNPVQVAALQKETAPLDVTELLNSQTNIQFKTASYQLEQHYVEQLDRVAQQLQADPKLVVQLFGYADRRGDENYNLTLSEKRADQIKRYLISKGVTQSQIETAGYGEAQPVAVKQTWENDFFDRRVVVRLTSEDAVMTAKQ